MTLMSKMWSVMEVTTLRIGVCLKVFFYFKYVLVNFHLFVLFATKVFCDNNLLYCMSYNTHKTCADDFGED